jgi:hypothetical protein
MWQGLLGGPEELFDDLLLQALDKGNDFVPFGCRPLLSYSYVRGKASIHGGAPVLLGLCSPHDVNIRNMPIRWPQLAAVGGAGGNVI